MVEERLTPDEYADRLAARTVEVINDEWVARGKPLVAPEAWEATLDAHDAYVVADRRYRAGEIPRKDVVDAAKAYLDAWRLSLLPARGRT